MTTPLSFPQLAAWTGGLILTAGTLSATSISIVNPSFQLDNFTASPGYTGGANPATITGWAQTGGAGINGPGAGGPGTPFADNGTIPDGNRAAFIQQTGSLTQNITGLVPGQTYWLQVYANSRSNPTFNTPLASITLGGNSLVSNAPVPSVAAAGTEAPWHMVNIPFTASATGGDLVFSTAPSTPGGDSALLLDGVTVIQRNSDEIVIFNPSFEASGTNIGGVGYLSPIAGWTNTIGPNGTAINVAGGPFSNGFVPEGQSFAVLQNTAGISQQLDGLVVGESYLLSMDYYGRDFGNAPTVEVTIDGNTALSGIIPNTGGQLTLEYTFIASSETPTLTLSNLGIGADSTFLFDNLSLRAIPEPSTTLLAFLAGSALLRRRR